MNVLDKKLIREIWKSKGQVIAVTMVITCGIAVLVAFLSCYQNLLLTKNAYYEKYRFHDFSIQVEKAPLTSLLKIKGLEGVRSARGRIVKDVNLSVEGQNENKIARIVSMPKDNTGIIDGVHLVSGNMIQSEVQDECVINNDFFKANNLKFGDRITVTTNGKKQSLKVVGTVLSPEYVYAIRNAQEMLPNPKKFAIAWVNNDWAETSFNMKGFFNEVVGEVYDPDKLNDIFDKADKILKSYGIYSKVKRKDQISNWYLNSEIQGLEVSSKVTPVIFLGIASVILIIILSRMIQKEKVQIGLLKAYGYSNTGISFHYLKFSLVIGIVGGLVGFLLGQWMGYGMMSMYVQFYSFPILKYNFYPNLFFWSMLISTICTSVSALYAVANVVKIMPADSMRDKPPKSANKTLLEKIPALWKRISFTNKIIIRNIWRYPFRASFTVFGVLLSTSIVVIGYFSSDAMVYMMDHQFKEVQKEDIRITFYIERPKRALYETYRFPYVKRSEPLLLYPFELKTEWKKKEILITGVTNDTQLYGLLDTESKQIELDPTGLTILDQSAKELGLKVGDYVTIKPLIGKVKREYNVVISKIVKQYIGTGAYMDINYLSKVLGGSEMLNAVLLKVEKDHIDELNVYLKDIPAIASVEVKKDSVDNFNKSVGESMGISNIFLTFFAAIIAISVIYNSTVISISERTREIATLQVLGFTEKEVGNIIFNENILLSIIGLLFGLPFGHYMCKLMAIAYETDLFRFPFYISNKTYVISSVTIIVFTIITNTFLRKKISKLDMVEALKSRE